MYYRIVGLTKLEYFENVNALGLFRHITIYGHFCQKYFIKQIFYQTLIKKVMRAYLMHVWKADLMEIERVFKFQNLGGIRVILPYMVILA